MRMIARASGRRCLSAATTSKPHPSGKADAPSHPMSSDHVRLQHIRQVHEASGRNVSETARRLNMHRRTLQRILSRQAGKKELRVPDCERLGSTSDQWH